MFLEASTTTVLSIEKVLASTFPELSRLATSTLPLKVPLEPVILREESMTVVPLIEYTFASTVPAMSIFEEPVNEPKISTLPVKLCLSSEVSPNLVEPDWYIIDADTNSV